MHLSNSQQTSLRMGYIYEKDIYTNQIFRIYGVLILGAISSPNHLAPAMISLYLTHPIYQAKLGRKRAYLLNCQSGE